MKQVRMNRLPDGDRERVAVYVSDEIRASVGDYIPHAKPMDATELHLAAATMALRLIQLSNVEGHGGAYIPEEETEYLLPTIIITRGMPEHRRRRVLAHEIANHLMRTRVAPDLYHVDEVICFGQDNRVVRHQIAQHVEQLMD